MQQGSGDVTRLLGRIGAGDVAARDELLVLVYPQLRALAGALMREESPVHTLQPTALVHEAYLRLAGGMSSIDWEGRAHFMGVAARAMRQVLVDHARRRDADKRGGGDATVALDDALAIDAGRGAADIVAVDDVLTRLEELDPRQAKVVEMRVFAGMSHPEIAAALGVSLRTVEGDWYVARAFLRQALGPG